MIRSSIEEISSTNTSLLIVDDNEDSLLTLGELGRRGGYSVHLAQSGEEALTNLAAIQPEVILLDLMMPGVNGLEVLRQVRQSEPYRDIPIILVSASNDLENTVSGLDLGADDYVVKPFRGDELLARLRNALRQRRDRRSRGAITLCAEPSSNVQRRNSEIIGKSESMVHVFTLTERVARTRAPVLISGESGTGKELVARAIHRDSARNANQFVSRNCAAFSDTLLESELFGHTRGAFTGAVQSRKGVFEAADGGTLFLDEVGEMTPALQAKVLRVLQEGTFTPVGSTLEKKADVRIIAATNRDLSALVAAGQFREDLFYRLNVLSIELPPLRARRDDIPLLIEHFLARAARENGHMGSLRIAPEVVEILTNYVWPGNVRELQNEIERMVILGNLGGDETGSVLGVECVSPRIIESVMGGIHCAPLHQGGRQLRDVLRDVERNLIAECLAQHGGNRSRVARELGMSRSNLLEKIREYGLN